MDGGWGETFRKYAQHVFTLDGGQKMERGREREWKREHDRVGEAYTATEIAWGV